MFVLRFFGALCAALVMTTSCALATTFYVSPDGHDQSAGTSPQHAWRTLERASKAPLRPGDSLLLHGGATFVGSLVFDGGGSGGTKEQPITVGSFGQGRAIIESNQSAVEVRSTSGVVVRDLIVRGVQAPGRGTAGVALLNTLPGARKLSFVRVENVEASGFGDAGILVAGQPTDDSQSGFADVEISDCVAHNNVFNGIHVDGAYDERATTYANANVRILRCRAYSNLGDPTYLDNWSGNGIFLANVDGGLIDGCEAWENGAQCNCRIGGPCGIWSASANGVTIQNCHSHHNRTGKGLDGAGFDLDGGVTNSVMQNNLSHDNDGTGYLLYTYAGSPHRFENNTLRGCISRNDGRKNDYGAVSVGHHGNALGVKNVRIEGCVFENSPSSTGHPCVVRLFTQAQVALENNVFLARGVPLVVADQKQREFSQKNNVWHSDGESGFVVGGNKVASLNDISAAK